MIYNRYQTDMEGVYCMSRFHTFNWKNIKRLIFSIAVPLLVGALSAWLSGNQEGVFDSVAKPPLVPPSWVFPVVWGVLYTLMGISAYLVGKADVADDVKRRALRFYYLQLAFNFFWSIFFFRFEWFGFSFLWLVALLILVIITAVLFYDAKRTAGWLMVPYVAWLAFAAYLNYMIWMMN